MPPTTIKPSARCCGNCRYWDDGTHPHEASAPPECTLMATADEGPASESHNALNRVMSITELTAYMANEYAMPMATGTGKGAGLSTPAHFHCRLWAEAQPEPSDDANAD